MEPITPQPHCLPMVNAIFRTIAVASGALFLTCAVAEAGVKEDLNRAMRQFDRDVCRTFDLKGCKSAPSKRQKSAPATRKTKAAPKPNVSPPPREKTARVPIPRQKPQVPASAAADPAIPASDSIIPIPRAKPIMPAEVMEHENNPPPAGTYEKEKRGGAEIAVVTPARPSSQSVAPPAAAVDPDCHQRLAHLGVTFAPSPIAANASRCTLSDPVKLSSVTVDGSKIEFPDQPTLNCPFAEAFARWIADKAEATVRREARSGLSLLYTGPGYQCRGRNGDGSAKLSEHGFGNAVDITFFKLQDGRTFQVADALNPVSPAYATLKSMRFTACERFSTVLGPGTNAAHANHFHFDNGSHGKTGTYRICE